MEFRNKFNEDFNKPGFAMPKLVQKNKIIAFVLCLLLGFFGFHRFYLEKYFTGVLQLILGLIFIWGNYSWICFIFVIIDLIRIAFDPRFTQKLKFNINVRFTNFSDSTIYSYKNSPFSNMHNRSEDDISIRELRDDEVEVTTHQPSQIKEDDKK